MEQIQQEEWTPEDEEWMEEVRDLERRLGFTPQWDERNEFILTADGEYVPEGSTVEATEAFYQEHSYDAIYGI